MGDHGCWCVRVVLTARAVEFLSHGHTTIGHPEMGGTTEHQQNRALWCVGTDRAVATMRSTLYTLRGGNTEFQPTPILP